MSLRYKFQDNFDSNSSSNSLCAKICRICHVVENKTSSDRQRPIDSGKTVKKFNLFQWILSLTEKGTCNAPADCDDEELIAPCDCRGTMRYVHRDCLNQWRSASPRSDSFTRCEQCFASYKFKNTWITSFLVNPITIYALCSVLFASWVIASTVVSTGALYNKNTSNYSNDLLNLLPTIYFDSKKGTGIAQLILPMNFIFRYNDFLESFNSIFYGLVFIALTEYIFFTPSFILSFNTLFCIWRIQRYELFFDKWLLVAFTFFGLWRAAKSLHGMIESATTRLVKLKLLEVMNQETD